MFLIYLQFTLLILALGCSSGLSVMGTVESRAKISALDKTSVEEGETLTIQGKSISKNLTLKVDEKSVELTIVDDNTAEFIMPEFAAGTIAYATFEDRGISVGKFAIVDKTKLVQSAIYPSLDSLCTDVVISNESGVPVRGTRNCSVAKADCTSDGQTDCLSNQEFPAAAKSEIANSVILGKKIAGIDGNVIPKPKDCDTNQEANCVTTSFFPAIDIASLIPSDIRSGVTILGVSGTLSSIYPVCSGDGETNCITTSAFVAVDKINTITANASKIRSSLSIAGVQGALSDCSSDGAVGCYVLGPSFAAASLSGASSKILSGQSLGGVTGSAPLRPLDCNADGATSCVAVTAFPAANAASTAAKVLSGQSVAGVAGSALGKPIDCAADGATNCVAVSGFPAVQAAGLAAKILNGQIAGGISGSAAERPSDCASDGASNCVAVAAFPAALSTGLASKVLNGQTVAGISGTAPLRPLDCSSDGATDCVAVSSFPAAASTGAASKVLAGQTLAGIAGTAPLRPADCAADGATACVAISSFPAVQKSLISSNSAKISNTLSLAGVTGSLPDCSVDGDVGCIVKGPSYAAALTVGLDTKLVSGQSSAGINGIAPLRPADCAIDGGTACVATATFPAANAATSSSKIVFGQTVAGISGSANGVRPPDCSTDAEISCVTIGTYPAMKVAGAAPKIALGDTLAGVAGTANVRPSDCSSDGATSCVAVSTFPAIDKSALTSGLSQIRSNLTIAGLSGSLADCASDGTLGCVTTAAFPSAQVLGAGAKILSGQTLAGVSGAAALRPADCNSEGATGCVTVTNYPSLDKANLIANANKIRSTLSLASITGTLADCASDGAVGCVSTAAFPSALAAGAAAKILSGQTLLGVLGSAAPRPSDCGSDGAIGCVAVAAYPSANILSAAAKILNGQTLAGVSGTASPRPSNCNSDGATDCVAVTAYPAALLAGASAKILTGSTLAGVSGSAALRPSDCVSDGALGCVTVAAYPSALGAGAGAKILSGQTLAGITGTAPIRPSDCASDGATGCVTVTAYPSALASGAEAKILTGQILAGKTGTAAIRPSDCSTDGATACVAVAGYPSARLANFTAADIKSGVTIAAIPGSATLESHSACSANAQTNCVANTSYKAADLTNLSVGNIKSGVSIAGTTGVYPNSTYPLSVADGYADLDSATFNAKIKTSSNFGWFNRNGTRYSAAGDLDLTAANIKTGIDIFGSTGTFAGGQLTAPTLSASSTYSNRNDLTFASPCCLASGVLIVRNLGGPVTWAPTNGSSYTVGTNVTGNQFVVVASNATSAADTGLTSGQVYYYAAWTYDSSNTYSSSAATAHSMPIASTGFGTLTASGYNWLTKKSSTTLDGYPMASGNNIQFTTGSNNQATAAFLPERYVPPFTVDFDYKLGADAADGFALSFGKNFNEYISSDPSGGGSCGVVPSGSGYALLFQTFNTNAIILKDLSTNTTLASVNVNMEAYLNVYTHVKIVVTANNVKVYMFGSSTASLDYTAGSNWNMAYPFIVLSAATGGQFTPQYLGNIVISTQ